jgi:para-aminobenzoate synthetase/4-amino-4-deoxychorismate lyase
MAASPHAILRADDSDRWLRFQHPLELFEAYALEEVVPQLQAIATAVQEQQLHAVGFISYEAAPAFDAALTTQPLTNFPLLHFGLYRSPTAIALPSPSRPPAYKLTAWEPSVSAADYDRAIARIKDAIAAGDTYQVNYCLRLLSQFSGDPWCFFLDLARAQRTRYSAFLDTGTVAICSVSPELFFRMDGDRVTLRPMKGTVARGRTWAEDERHAQWLHTSVKDRAENLMIVDMIRNDIGRVAALGSVTVPRLFEVERYPSLLQMTSTVEATTQESIETAIATLFPCASITGAPKARTMDIIAELEPSPRKLYTGCIGYIAPHRQAQFSVAIRTVVIDKASGQAEYGVGSGIVWDSTSQNEYAECAIKAQILTQRFPDFALLESLLWEPESGYFLVTEHLQRLQNSAQYFGIPVDGDRVQETLQAIAAALPAEPHKIRFLVAPNGNFSHTATPFTAALPSAPAILKLAVAPVHSTDPFLFHKTTHRQVYDRARAAEPNGNDVILWNERGEVTETCTANLVVELGGEYVTPPVDCGLLAGTYRQWLLEQGKIREQVVPVELLEKGDRLFTINSVRKWQEARWER